MSQSEVVQLDDSIQLPSGVAAAFNRSRSVFLNSDAFVDRIFAANSLVNEIHSWRWAGVISSDHCNFLLRKVRRDLEQHVGTVGEWHNNTAEEILAREKACEEERLQWQEEENLRLSGT